MSSKWVRFNGSLLNIKNKMASLSSIFPVGAGYNTGATGLSREAKKCAIPLGSGRIARQERGIQTKQGDWFPQLLVDADLIPTGVWSQIGDGLLFRLLWCDSAARVQSRREVARWWMNFRTRARMRAGPQ